ncbi:hypothetical protein NMY22_g2054 [Coprinellus aureogranulatus]|nr:hypothetical protein NMY22_g2054 [Coprinellus aureogranulatus]
MRDCCKENKRNTLQQRILEVEEDILSFKRSYNTLSPPNRLPVEILSTIFIMHCARAMEELPSSDPESCSWIRVTHVCHHWRAVAMTCTQLWSNLLFVTPELTQFMLALSKTSPLSLKFRYMHEEWTDTLCKMLVSQSYRLRSVELAGLIDAPVLESLAASTSALEKLIIQPDVNFRDPLDLPSDFHKKSAPLLKHLELLDVVMPNHDMLPLLPSLTHLSLGSPSAQPLPRPAGQALLNALRLLPHLHTLALWNCISQDLAQKFRRSLSPIDFPALRKLEVEDVVHPVCGLLDFIRIPDQTTTKFTFHDSFTNLQDLHRLVTTIATAWSGGRRLVVRTLTARHFVFRYSKYLVLEFNFYLPPPTEHRYNPEDIEFSFACLWDPEDTSVAPVLSSFTESLWDFSAPCAMILRTDPFFSTDQWNYLSSTLPRLGMIVFESTPVDFFLQAFSAESSTSSPTFPALSIIYLASLKPENWDFTQDAGSMHLLANALKHRPPSHRITEMTVKKCSATISSEDLDFVREQVPDLLVKE